MNRNGLTYNYLVIWLLCLGSVISQAQQPIQRAVLTGQITNAADGQPLPFASVYLNGTTRGTTTDDKGNFTLADVPFGSIELVVSYTGFSAMRQAMRITETRPRPVAIALSPLANQLADVVVKAGKDKTWQKQLKQFKYDLLGTSSFASSCVLMNPEVLTFTAAGKVLMAEANAPLVIMNEALGYRLRYTLLGFRSQPERVVFGGTTLFEPLIPATPKQTKQWQRNRQTAYQGSLRHLLVSLAAGTYEQEGFLVYQADPSRPLANNPPPLLESEIGRHLKLFDPKTMLIAGTLPHERWLRSLVPFEVFYTRIQMRNSPYRDAPFAFSQLILPKQLLGFTVTGDITAPLNFDAVGYLSDDRLATALPDDWQNSTPPATPRRDTVATQLSSSAAPKPDTAWRWKPRPKGGTPPVFVHVDKPLYLTGDHLWFSSYLLDPQTQQVDTALIGPALNIELWSTNQTLVQHQWLPVSDGRAAGSFRLSDTLSTGTYWLRAYTEADRSQGRSAFERPVWLVNGRQGLAPKQADSRSATGAVPAPVTATSRRPSALPVTLTTALGEPAAGQRPLSLTLLDGANRPVNAYVSVAIIDADKVPTDSLVADFSTYLATLSSPKAGFSAPRNTPDISLHGTVTTPEKQPVNVMMLVGDGQNVTIRATMTTPAGHFRLDQLALTDTAQVLFRVTSSQGKPVDARVQLDQKATELGPLPRWEGAEQLLSRWKGLIEAARQRQEAEPALYRQNGGRQLREVVVRAMKPIDQRPDDIQRRSLHNQVDQTIVLDYMAASFDNMYTLIRSKVPGAFVQEVLSGGRVAYSVNLQPAQATSILNAKVAQQTSSFGPPPPPKAVVESPMQNPLFLMDGFPITDTDGTQLLMFSPATIERIEVLKTGGIAGIYGLRATNGVIAFYTKTTREAAKAKGVSKQTVLGYPAVVAFVSPTQLAVSQADVLAWVPSGVTSQQGQLSVPVVMPPALRVLRITIQGITDAGQPISCVQTITVR